MRVFVLIAKFYLPLHYITKPLICFQVYRFTTKCLKSFNNAYACVHDLRHKVYLEDNMDNSHVKCLCLKISSIAF